MRKLFLLFYSLLILMNMLHAKAIKNVSFTWKDGKPFVKKGDPYTNVWTPLGGSAFIQTMTLRDDDGNIIAVKDESEFLLPTDVGSNYSYGSSEAPAVDKYVFYQNTEGYYLCQDPARTEDCVQDSGWMWTSDPRWHDIASQAFASKNLNFYVGASRPQGSYFTSYDSRSTNTPIHTLNYGNGVKIGNSGDGYVIITERGGNNSFLIVAKDKDNQYLGNIFVKKASGTHCSQNTDPESPYVPSGRMQDVYQEICVAVYPIQDLAAPGTTIGSIEMWAASSDPGDGKIMFVHTLEEPQICYDYSVRKDGITLPSDGREFSTDVGGELSISVALRSMISDYDMEKSKLTITPPPSLTFSQAEYSPNHVNALIPAIETGGAMHEIAIGNNAGIEGGTIKSEERYFTKFTYNTATPIHNGKFEVDLNITVDTSEAQNNPIVYQLTTDPNKYNAENTIYQEITRCPQSEVYQSDPGSLDISFNVERIDSKNYSASGDPSHRFPLFTQIAGRDFDFSIVAYSKAGSPAYTNEISLKGYTVDVEMIDVSSYEDNTSFFRCSDTNPEIIQPINSGQNNLFVSFDNESRVDVSDPDDMITDRALKNTAFRVWVLTDGNGTVVPYSCTDKGDDACFEAVYNSKIKVNDTGKYCNDCSSYSGGCYQCLKDYFSTPICSRDNFAIRPASYRIKLSDTNESTNPTSPLPVQIGDNHGSETVASLVAGYQYKFDVKATLFGGDDKADGYERRFQTPSDEYLISQLQFDDNAACVDQNNTDFGIYFSAGEVSDTVKGASVQFNSNNLQKHSNVGNYKYHIEDISWTWVDQKSATTSDGKPLKTYPDVDDCTGYDADGNPDRTPGGPLYAISDDGNSMSGCGISSELKYSGQEYHDMKLRYEPYTFDLKSFAVTFPNDKNFIYMNNLKGADTINREMAAHVDGNITAMTKDNEVATNYTDGCAAHPVAYDLNRTMFRYDANDNKVIINPKENHTDVGALQEEILENRDIAHCTDEVPGKISFARTYENQAGRVKYSTENNTTDPKTTVAIDVLSSEFYADNEGVAFLKTVYNFERSPCLVVDPVRVTFAGVEANATEAKAWAGQTPNYIPKGYATIGTGTTTLDFYYGRAVASKNTPYLAGSTDDSIVVPLLAEVYCDTERSNPDRHGLGAGDDLHVVSEHPEWLVIGDAKHRSVIGDGKVWDINTSAGCITEIDPTHNVNLNDDGDQTDIKVSGTHPCEARLEIHPDPWLLDCNCSQAQHPIVIFPTTGGWAGQGNTGFVIETKPYNDANRKRVEW